MADYRNARPHPGNNADEGLTMNPAPDMGWILDCLRHSRPEAPIVALPASNSAPLDEVSALNLYANTVPIPVGPA